MNQWIFTTAWCIPFYSLLGVIVTLPWSLGLIQRTGSRPAAYLNILASVVAFLHGLWALVIGEHAPPQKFTWHWLQAVVLNIRNKT